jgi:hypothetical protein
MPKTTAISASTDPELERGMEAVLGEAARVPNAITVEALEQAKARRRIESFDTLDDLFEDLGI